MANSAYQNQKGTNVCAKSDLQAPQDGPLAEGSKGR